MQPPDPDHQGLGPLLRNTLLDRALVVGSARVPGYFADVLTASREYAAATAQGRGP